MKNQSTSSCISNLTVTNWWDSIEPEDLIANSCAWPWTRLTPDEFLSFWRVYQRMENHGEELARLYQSAYFICVVGILGNFLSLLTLCRGNFKQPSYLYHKSLAGCDFCFNLMFLVHTYIYLNYTEIEKTLVGSWYRIIEKAPDYGFSLASDFIAIAIAFERMIGARFPTRYHTINTNRVASMIICLAAILGLAGRFHYSLTNGIVTTIDPISNETRYHLQHKAFYYTVEYTCWYMYSDEILPFIIMAAVVALSLVTLLTIVKRYLKQKKVHQQQQVTVETPAMNDSKTVIKKLDQQTEQMRTATQLLMASTGMCILNQLGWIVYTVTWHVFDNTEKTFDVTPDRVRVWLDRHRAYDNGFTFQTVAECSTRVMHFLLYVTVSKAFRAEFLKVIRCCKKTENNGSGGASTNTRRTTVISTSHLKRVSVM